MNRSPPRPTNRYRHQIDTLRQGDACRVAWSCCGRWLLKSSAFPRSFLCLLCKTVKCMATLPRLPVPADCECLSVVASCRGESVAGLSCGVALPGSNQSPVWTSHRTWVASVFSPCVLECDGASCFIQYVFTPVCLSTRNLSIYLSITRLTLQVPGDTICFANEPSLGSDQSSAAPAGNKCAAAARRRAHGGPLRGPCMRAHSSHPPPTRHPARWCRWCRSRVCRRTAHTTPLAESC